MTNYLKFNFKLLRKKELLFTLVLCFLAVIILFIFNTTKLSNENQQRIDYYHEMGNKKIAKSLENEQWTAVEKHELADISNASWQNSTGFSERGINFYSFSEGKYLLNKKLLKNNLPMMSTRYGTSSSLFIVSLLTYLTSFVGIFLIGFLAFQQSGRKFEGENINFLNVQPIKKWQVIIGDYLTFLVLALSYLFFMLLVGVLVSSLVSGISPLSYPLVTRVNGDFALISVGKFIPMVLVLEILVYSLFLFLAQLVVLFVKSSFLSSLLVTLLLVGSFSAFGNLQLSHPASNWVAANYLQPTSLFIGQDQKAIKINAGPEGHTYENPAYFSAETLSVKRGLALSFSKGLIALIFSIVLVMSLDLYMFHYYANFKGVVTELWRLLTFKT